MQLTAFALAAVVAAVAQQTATLNVPGTPENAPVTLTGCLMPAGGTTSMPGSGGAAGTGPAGMNADAANSGVFFALPLGRKRAKPSDSSYSLVGIDGPDVQRYSKSRVEVQGVLLPAAQSTAPDKTLTIATGKGKPKPAPTRQF